MRACLIHVFFHHWNITSGGACENGAAAEVGVEGAYGVALDAILPEFPENYSNSNHHFPSDVSIPGEVDLC